MDELAARMIDVTVERNVYPTSSSALLDPENLRYLRHHAFSIGMSCDSFTVTPGHRKGYHFLGIIAKIHIESYVRGIGMVHTHWVVKSAPSIPYVRRVVGIKNLYEREIYFYTQLTQYLGNLQNAHRCVSPFAHFPKFVAACDDEGKECVVMEDMTHHGFFHRQRNVPLDVDHVKAVMKALGKLHAVYYAYKKQKTTVLRDIISNTPMNYHAWLEPGTEDAQIYANSVRRKLISCLDPEKDAPVMIVLKLFTDSMLRTMEYSMDMKTIYSIIIQGDVTVSNMLFKYGLPGKPKTPTDVCLLDWQLARYTSPACDLTYFLFTSTSKSFRDEYYDDMIRLYYHTLCAHLVELRCDPEDLLPYKALITELRRFAIVALYRIPDILHLMLSEDSEIPNWQDSTSTAEAVEKLNYVSKNEILYTARLREVVLDYADKGYFDFLMELL